MALLTQQIALSNLVIAAVDKMAELEAQGRKYVFLEEVCPDKDAHISLGIQLERRKYNRFRMKVGKGPKSVWLVKRGSTDYSPAEARQELLLRAG